MIGVTHAQVVRENPMSAPPLLRLADERRVTVAQDAAMVHRVLDEDPVGSCMVASRVAEHGVDPAAIGGELWTRKRPGESLCFAGANLIPLRVGDGGRGYRRRVAGLIAAGRAWARFEGGKVVFKAEIGSQSPRVGQIQGVWVHPEWRGRGLGAAGTATLTAAIVRGGRTASLYVNGYNTVARATYARVGFDQVGTFATVLLD